jgi:hypothetical protein
MSLQFVLSRRLLPQVSRALRTSSLSSTITSRANSTMTTAVFNHIDTSALPPNTKPVSFFSLSDQLLILDLRSRVGMVLHFHFAGGVVLVAGHLELQ